MALCDWYVRKLILNASPVCLLTMFASVPDFTKQVTIIINEDNPNASIDPCEHHGLRRGTAVPTSQMRPHKQPTSTTPGNLAIPHAGMQLELSTKFPRATFTVPQEFLAKDSLFFRAACSHKRPDKEEEGQASVVKLYGVELESFKAYLFRAHKGEIGIATEFPKNAVDDRYRQQQTASILASLAKLWLLGNRLQDTRLRNSVMDAFLHAMIDGWSCVNDVVELLPPATIFLIWSASSTGCALRRLVLNCYLRHSLPWTLQGCLYELHGDFVRDLMMLALHREGRTRDNPPFDTQCCEYHDHDEEHPRCRDSEDGDSEEEEEEEDE